MVVVVVFVEVWLVVGFAGVGLVVLLFGLLLEELSFAAGLPGVVVGLEFVVVFGAPIVGRVGVWPSGFPPPSPGVSGSFGVLQPDNNRQATAMAMTASWYW